MKSLSRSMLIKTALLTGVALLLLGSAVAFTLVKSTTAKKDLPASCYSQMAATHVWTVHFKWEGNQSNGKPWTWLTDTWHLSLEPGANHNYYKFVSEMYKNIHNDWYGYDSSVNGPDANKIQIQYNNDRTYQQNNSTYYSTVASYIGRITSCSEEKYHMEGTMDQFYLRIKGRWYADATSLLNSSSTTPTATKSISSPTATSIPTAPPTATKALQASCYSQMAAAHVWTVHFKWEGNQSNGKPWTWLTDTWHLSLAPGANHNYYKFVSEMYNNIHNDWYGYDSSANSADSSTIQIQYNDDQAHAVASYIGRMTVCSGGTYHMEGTMNHLSLHIKGQWYADAIS